MLKKIFAALSNPNILYITIETEFTRNHVEKLLSSCRDRGTLKWIAETKQSTYQELNKEKPSIAAQCATIDHNDMFPRFYFYINSFINEFDAWCKMRHQTILDVEAPEGFQRIHGSLDDIISGVVTHNEDGFTIDWQYKPECVEKL